MKTFISNFWLLGIALMAAATVNFSSCKDDENGVDTPDNPTGQIDSLVTYYDDLEYFQNYFVRTDALGNLRYRSMGVPLYESDSAHLYIGVDNLDEALRYFNYAIAPDIEQKVSVTNNYTYTLTSVVCPWQRHNSGGNYNRFARLEALQQGNIPAKQRVAAQLGREDMAQGRHPHILHCRSSRKGVDNQRQNTQMGACARGGQWHIANVVRYHKR